MNRKDIFICHASEDKTKHVKPLCQLLKKYNISYWLDEDEVALGDDLEDKIHRGIKNSKFMLVIFSASFMNKNWANKELEYIRKLEKQEDDKFLLPIIEDVSQQQILARYDFLRDRRFLKLSEKVELIEQLKALIAGTGSITISLYHDDMMYQMSKFNRVLYWTAKVVPIKQTEQFFSDLQCFFVGHNVFVGSLNNWLANALDRLCRILCNITHVADDYCASKLSISLERISFYIGKERDYDMDTHEALYVCERELNLNMRLSVIDRSVLTIYLLLLRYLTDYSVKDGYHQIPHEVGYQLYILFSETLPLVMASELPPRYDQVAWDNIYSRIERSE
jgi:hypothetical protein